jgi:hypothetical protein
MTTISLLRSRALTVSVACPADQLYRFASNPANFPTWVTSFVTSARHTEAGWRLKTTDGEIGITFAPENPFGVLDHVVTVVPGVEIMNPLRVVPNGAGCEVMFTLFQRPEMTDTQFDADASMVEHDLQTLKRLME